MTPPIHDEIESIEGPGFTGFIQYDLDKEIDLPDEVYGDDLNYGYDVTPAPMTPRIEQQPSLKPDELCNEINKIYMNQLNSEFQPSSTKQQEINEQDIATLQDEIVCRLFQVEEKAVDQWVSLHGESLL